MNGVPDHTDQRELFKRFIEQGRPATLEAIAEVVEGGGGSYYFRKTYRDQTGESALVEVVLSFESGLPAGLEQMMREAGVSNNPISPDRTGPTRRQGMDCPSGQPRIGKRRLAASSSSPVCITGARARRPRRRRDPHRTARRCRSARAPG